MLSHSDQPNSMESEQLVLASCLLSSDGSKYDEVSQILHEQDFFYDQNLIIYKTIKQLALLGDEVNEKNLETMVMKVELVA